MSNDRLLQNVVSILIMAGYNVSERCEIRPRSFDLMTSTKTLPGTWTKLPGILVLFR